MGERGERDKERGREGEIPNPPYKWSRYENAFIHTVANRHEWVPITRIAIDN